MKRAILLSSLFLILLLTPAIAQAREECTPADEILEDHLQVRYNFAEYRLERHRLGMEAVIDYLEETDGDTEELVTIKENFLEAGEELEEADSIMEYNSLVADLLEYAKDFREHSRNEVEDLFEARERVRDALDDNEEELESTLNKAKEELGAHQLKIFDDSVCRFRNRVEFFEDIGYDTEEMDGAVEEYEDMRGEIEDTVNDAVGSCEDTPLFLCDTDEKEEYFDLREEVVDKFHEMRTTVGLSVAEQFIGKTENILDDFEEKEIDVEELRDELEEIKDDFDDAEEEFGSGDHSLDTELRSIRRDTIELRIRARQAWVDHIKDRIESFRERHGGDSE